MPDKTTSMNQNPEIDLAYNFIQYTNRNLYLTGKAGTGKTTFLQRIRREIPKRMAVVAPTGVAAINAGGVTIHSFFQMPFGPIIPGNDIHSEGAKKKFNKKKIDLIRSLDLLIIDEISMVRADLLDGIDQVLRKYRYNNSPFGGIQLLMIGDLQQLPPVTKNHEWDLLRPYYESEYFFSSNAFKESQALSIELKHVYRQSDRMFISILEEIRNNTLGQNTLEVLNERYIPDFKPDESEGYISLTTHNAYAHNANSQKLAELKRPEHHFKAEILNLFPTQNYPTEEILILKEGAQVMFVKNDPSPEKLFYNGKIGRITSIEDDVIFVQCKGDDEAISVEKLTWENIKYTVNPKNQEIKEDVIGTFSQYPLRLAWSITIHKSQGLTFDKVIIDAESAFAHGQTYVALSRCRTLEGIVLSSRISERSVICDKEVTAFTKEYELHPPTKKMLQEAKSSFQLSLLQELFDFDQLRILANTCLKIVRENNQVIEGNIYDQLLKILTGAINPLVSVAAKFKNELAYSMLTAQDAEENEHIQDRVKKGAQYFLGKTLTEIQDPFKELTWETDNTAVRAKVKAKYTALSDEIRVKTSCLQECLKGFAIAPYLKAKAKALIDDGKTYATTEPKQVHTQHPELYRALQKWRSQRTEIENIPFYFIASQKLIITITNELPISEDHLLTLPGLGIKRVDKYGPEIIKIVQSYCDSNGIEPSQRSINVGAVIEKKPKKEKPKKGDSQLQSFNLYKEGLSISEISIARNLAPTTIQSHLAHFIEKGEIPVLDLLSEEKLNTITTFFKKNPKTTLKTAKEQLPADISYTDIRFAFAYEKSKV